MRYRATRSARSRRGQILTPPELALRLADCLRVTSGDWLELGSGSGRLLEACVTSRSINSYVGVELDQRLGAWCPSSPPVELHNADVLQPQELDATLGSRRFSCVLGNPPFGVERLPLVAQARLKTLYPEATVTKGWGRLDLYFMLESLTRLKRPGEAAFVVAAPIVQEQALSSFRRILIDAASELECYELPPKTFDKRAEVQSFLLIARFGSKLGARVTLGRLGGENFEITQTRLVDRKTAIERMDLAHHEFNEFNRALSCKGGFMTLSDLGANICRGSRSRCQFEDMALEHFHTSDFPHAGCDLTFGRVAPSEFQTASAGHILVPRVGSRCIDRAAIVAKGRRAFTEAVFRIEVPKRARNSVFDWISSEDGKDWRRRAAYGSCAKHLTVSSLLAMPVPA
ncbi:MAG: N-6 DNA methylase [Betaproteobacteria bacterium]